MLQRLLAGIFSLLATCAQAAPAIVHWQTAAGTRVFFVQVRSLPLLDIAAEFAAGSAYDPPGFEGLSRLAHALLKEGSEKSSATELGNRLAEVGALLSPTFDRDRAGYRLRTLASERERRQAIEAFAEMLQQPAFPLAAFEREKERLVSGTREEEARPATLAERRLFAAMYGDHPYGRVPSEASIRTIVRERVPDFYRRHYSAGNAVITLVGDLSEADARGLAEQLSARLPREASPPPPPEVKGALAESGVLHSAHPSEQSHILLGAPALARQDPDYFALYLGNYVLGGGGFVSRLYRAVREERGLVYSVYSYFQPLAVRGPFLLGLQTERRQTDEALSTVREVLQRFVAQGPTERELQAAKRGIAGGFALRTDSNLKILNEVTQIGFYGLPLDWLERFVPSVQKLSVTEVRKAFAKHVDPAMLTTVIVGAPQ
jgi:zinc protease